MRCERNEIMALFDRFGRKKTGLPAASKARWEISEEFPPEASCDPAEDPGSAFDPLGSYTGVPEDGGEPTQDADDL